MNIIINNTLMIPIYEQLKEQIKQEIKNGALKSYDNLPSVRQLAKDLKISALTVKKAYDLLEEEGIVKTIHGKGTYVTEINKEIIREEQIKKIEDSLANLIEEAKLANISFEEIKEMFNILTEDYDVKN